MKNRYVILFMMFALVFSVLSTLIGCGVVKRYTPLDETNVHIVISPNFDINKHRKIAVMPFYGIGRYNINEKGYGTVEVIPSDIFAAKMMGIGFSVVERTQLQRIISELELSQSGLLAQSDINKVGNLLNVDLLVMGSASGWGKDWGGAYGESNIKFIDTVTGEMLVSIMCNNVKGRDFFSSSVDILNGKLIKNK